MSAAEVLEMTKNVVTAAAAVTGVAIAWIGLNNWRRQKEFDRDSELARKLLVEVYRFDSALNNARSMVEHGRLRRLFRFQLVRRQEQAEELDDQDIDVPNKALMRVEHEVDLMVFDELYEKVATSSEKLRELTFEATALWDNESEIIYRSLLRFEIEWRQAAESSIALTDFDSGPFESVFAHYEKFGKAFCRENVLESDDFDRRVAEAVKFAEIYLKPKLAGRKS